MVEFLRIEPRGGDLVAVLRWDRIDSRGRDELVLNEASLRDRIANLEREGRPAWVERTALGMLVQAKERGEE